MPLYEYKCERCGQVFEILQKFSDQPLTVHEACGGPVHRLLSPPALQFKGSGWYVTDYARGNGGKSSESKSTESKSSESKSSESKPASESTTSSSETKKSSSSSGTETKST